MRVNRMLPILILVLALTACSVLTQGQPGPPPPSGDMLAGGDTPAETPAVEIQSGDLGPAPTPADAPVAAGTAALGEVLFVRDGQIYATTIDTAQERPLTAFELGRALRSLVLSPDARYLAFTIDGAALGLLDLSQGTLRTLESDEPTIVSSLIWAPSGSALHFQRTRLDVETYAPQASAVVRLDPATGDTVDLVAAEFSEGREVTPVAVLPDGKVVIAQSDPQEDSTVVDLQVWSDGALTPLDTGDLSGAGLAAFSPDGAFALFVDPAAPADLQLAPFNSEAAFTAASTVASLDAGLGSLSLAPDGSILAIAGGQPYLLIAAGAGEYTLSALDAGPEGTRTLSLAYQSEGNIVAARLPADGGPTELVVLPTDGSAATPLATGEQPVAVLAW